MAIPPYTTHARVKRQGVGAGILKDGFLGIKSYLSLSPLSAEKELRIFDFFPRNSCGPWIGGRCRHAAHTAGRPAETL